MTTQIKISRRDSLAIAQAIRAVAEIDRDSLVLRAIVQQLTAIMPDGARPAFKSQALGLIDLSGIDRVAAHRAAIAGDAA